MGKTMENSVSNTFFKIHFRSTKPIAISKILLVKHYEQLLLMRLSGQ